MHVASPPILGGFGTELFSTIAGVMTSRMRPTPILLSCAVSTFLAVTPARASEMAAAAPRADARLLRALESGADSFQIVLGLRDGTPSARALRFSPDAKGEPAR